LGKLQDGGRFDFVYERYSLFGVAGREFARKARLPFVLEVNAPLVDEASAHRGLELTQLARATEQYLFSTADHIVTVSDTLRQHVLKVAPNAEVTVVPNGVDVERFRATGRSARWRETFSGDAGNDLVV
jgi:glycosyltransferase involved in cell wall biosynthesis